jgi:hypothetical protein
MFPDGRTRKATKKMLLKHNLCLATREMNIVPGLHSALVSIPKIAGAGYTTVFNKMAQLSTMTKQQRLRPQIPPSWNQNNSNTPECGHQTSTQKQPSPIKKSQQHHPRHSTSSLISRAPAKHSTDTTHPQDSCPKRPLLTPSTKEITPHGQN